MIDKYNFDVVILASLGGIFRSNKNSIKKLRTQVRPGGYIVIDDGNLKKREFLRRKGYRHYRNYENTVEELTTFNDRLLNEIPTTEVSTKINDEYLKVIENRSIELIDQYPELEKDLYSYLDVQIEPRPGIIIVSGIKQRTLGNANSSISFDVSTSHVICKKNADFLL